MLSGCCSLGVDGWGSTTWIGGGQDRKISPQGTGWHTQGWNMGFDLCSLEAVGRMGSGASWYRSDQSRPVGEWWWSGTVRRLACINGQPQVSAFSMRTFMTGYKCTDLYEAAHTYTQGDLDTESPQLWECVCGTWIGLIYWHQDCPTYSFLHTICECVIAIEMDWHSPSFCPVKLQRFWKWKLHFLQICPCSFMHSFCMATFHLVLLHATALLSFFFSERLP